MTDLLVGSVKHFVELDYPYAKGKTVRKDLQQVEKSTGKEIERLHKEEPEHELWDVFWEITSYESITSLSLFAYCFLHSVKFSWWEIELLQKMESAKMWVIQSQNRGI